MGETDWDETLDELFDEIDAAIPIDPDDPPSSGDHTGSLVVNRHTDRGVPVLQYDHGSGGSLEQVSTSQRWAVHNVAWTTLSQTIYDEWTFDELVTGDITGHAHYVDTVDSADFATNTEQLDEHPIENYGVSNRDFTVTGTWTFEEMALFEDGFTSSGGTVSLSKYDTPILDIDDDDDIDPDPEPEPEEPEVRTRSAASVTSEGATLVGEVEEIGDYDRLYAYFQYQLADEHDEESGRLEYCGPSISIEEPTSFWVEYPRRDGLGAEVFQPGATIVWNANISPRPCASGWHGQFKQFQLPEEGDETATTLGLSGRGSGPVGDIETTSTTTPLAATED